MAERIVVLGHGGNAVEIPYAMDADAFVSAGSLKVSLTMWSGPLANATVLMPTEKLLGCAWENSSEADYERAFKTLLRMCQGSFRLTLETPIPVGLNTPSIEYPR